MHFIFNWKKIYLKSIEISLYKLQQQLKMHFKISLKQLGIVLLFKNFYQFLNYCTLKCFLIFRSASIYVFQQLLYEHSYFVLFFVQKKKWLIIYMRSLFQNNIVTNVNSTKESVESFYIMNLNTLITIEGSLQKNV